MKIAIIGTRGIPNQYGGYEQFAEYAAPALAARGHEVYVYNSSLHPLRQKMWHGVHLIRRFDPENRVGSAGQFVYDLSCILDARRREFDIILQLGYTSSSIWSFLMPKRSLVITNMDGLEWKRQKYSKRVQRFLKKAEKWAALSSDYLIADSLGIQSYLKEEYKKDSTFIAYGAQVINEPDEKVLEKGGLEKFGYDMLIARMEPENNVETVIRAHQLCNDAKPLVIIGQYTNKFGSYLRSTYKSKEIRFLGPVFDLQVLNSLRYYSHLYFHGHSVGGTNPSLLEAMASHALIVAHDNIFNRSVLGDDAFYFNSAEQLATLFAKNIRKDDHQSMIDNNVEKIINEYAWPVIIDRIERLFQEAMDQRTKN
jgi:glycosyltransferase involved in cell wall biosynthesis